MYNTPQLLLQISSLKGETSRQYICHVSICIALLLTEQTNW